MNIIVDAPIQWRKLSDIYEYYLEETPSAEGISAAELIARIEKQTQVQEVAIRVEAASGRMTQDKRDYVLACIREAKQQANLMQAIVTNIMTRDGITGIWIAVGRPAEDAAHELIPPGYWKILRIDVERGCVERDNIKFEDVHCAFAEDLPEGHPILQKVFGNPPMREGVRAAEVFRTVPQNGSVTQRSSHAPTPPADSVSDHTRPPGRPSYIPLVKDEFQRRCLAGEVYWSSLSKEANHLAKWFKSTHPKFRPIAVNTIKNRLRDDFNNLKASSGKAPK